jgi:trans-aconitate 2-methyltransferase
VLGIDSSPEMLAAAAERAIPGRLEFAPGDVRDWAPAEPLDLIISNATLHWVPEHETLLPRLASYLAPRGAIAVQMPANFDAATHVLINETLAEDPRWQALKDWRPAAVHPLSWYVEKLWACGLIVDGWETVYLHVLHGDDPVLEWVKGSALRPVLARLPEADRPAFTAAYAAKLRSAYPRTEHGTVLPFRRVFFVGRRP